VAKFRFRDVEYPVLKRPTFGEIAHVERLLKCKYDDWSSFDIGRATAWLAIRRVDHTALPWEATDDLTPEDFEAVKEPEPTEDDPSGG
jgi:hypothetical protein